MRKKALCYLAVTLNAITMKKALFISLCALLLAGTGCKKNVEPEPQKVAVTGVSLKPNTLSLKVGEAETLSAVVIPANADNKTVSWSTSDPSVATMANGLVTAVKEGSATITVTTIDGGKTATCAVTVSTDIVPVTGITIDQGATAEVEEGKTITLTATVQPDNATDKTVTWASAHESVATVVDGVVTGIAPGQAIISAKAGDKTATCTVTVTRSAVAYEAVDLGLSVKWANKNLGAEFPEDTGNLYAWGETEPNKASFDWDTYQWGNSETSLTKYNHLSDRGVVDNKLLLEADDDVASTTLQGEWRMPTHPEMEELYATNWNPDYQWEMKSGGWKVTYLVNNNSIFIPFSEMWTSSLHYGNSSFAWIFEIDDVNYYGSWGMGQRKRHLGLSVRPVSGPRPEPADGKLMKEVTAEDLGKVIGSDGKVYPSTMSAVASGAVATAVIVYVGSETAEGGFAHGLAMSMRDAARSGGLTFKWKTVDGNYDNPQRSSDLHTLLGYKESGYALTKDRGESPWEAFAAAKNNTIYDCYGISATAPEGTSGWFLPSMYQWQQAIHAMTGKTEELSLYEANPNYVNDYFNAKIADSEAFLTKNCYASSSEFDDTYNWHFDFKDGIARRNAKYCDYYVRAFLAFYGEILHPTAVKLNKTEASRYAGGVVDLKANVIPAGATNKDVTWSSSDESVATVDDYGYVTVLAEGEAIITATTMDGGLTSQCKLTVNPIPNGAVFSADAFNSSTDKEPLLILQQNLSNSTVYIRKASGTIDFNGHTVKYVYMQNNDPDKVVGLCNGIISGRLDGDAGWYRYTGQTFHGKVMMEDMEVYKEFYTDGHVYTLNSGYYETVCTFRVGDALGDVYIYGGSFGKLFDVNPDAGSSQGDIFLFGGKFAIDPRTYTNAGTTNPRGNTRFIIGEGYSVKENTEEDKDEFPYIVSKD